ncbi:uncharacterized protein si:ch211-198m17.1 isoform X6 [Danio rerio]|uniref:Uncharacterized protein si:ch211-198m17.1 isoform X6 n=1 Tax=Danio rerio TaxID=7955 RepID=A0AC58J382_DANRE
MLIKKRTMLLTHRLFFLLILISTSAVTEIDANATGSPTSDPTMTVAPSIPSGNTSTAFPNSATTSALLTTRRGDVTSLLSSTQDSISSSSTTPLVNATSSSVSTSGNATTSPAPVANITSPLEPTAGNATTDPVTAPGDSTTTNFLESGNSTSLPHTTSGNYTSPLISSPGYTTAPSITTPSNVTITAQTTSGNDTTANYATTSPSATHLPTPENNATGSATTPPITTPGNFTTGDATSPPLTSSGSNTTGNATASPMTTPVNATTQPLITTGNGTTESPSRPSMTTPVNSTIPPISTPESNTSGNATAPSMTTPVIATTQPLTTPENNTTGTCPTVPCPSLSVCVNSVCQCLAGTVLLNNVCVETKTFASSLRVNRTFDDAMNDPKSPQFQEFANEIMAAVNGAMRNQKNYINCTVIKLMPGSVVATVNMLFEPNSQVTQESVSSAITTAIQQCNNTNCGILAGAQYSETSLCAQNPPPCDTETTVCNTKDGSAICTCVTGYIPSPYQIKSCSACPSGSKAYENKCVPCSFGYSGFNCNDSSLLALVVVACVLGGLLLIVIVVAIIYICKRKKPDINYFSSPYSAGDYRTHWTSQEVGHIPRATLTSTSSHDVSGNSLEMSEAMGKGKGHSNGLTGSYDLTSDSMRTFKDPNPTRYSYLVGHENPYFIPGDEKR